MWFQYISCTYIHLIVHNWVQYYVSEIKQRTCYSFLIPPQTIIEDNRNYYRPIDAQWKECSCGKS